MAFRLTEISSTPDRYSGRLRVDEGTEVSLAARAHSNSGANGNWTSVRLIATPDSGPIVDRSSGEVPSEYADVHMILQAGEYDVTAASDNHLASSDYLKVICQET